MPNTLKRNAVIVLGLAVLFYWSFMFAKHDPVLRGVIPFADDPYDAVGSFASVVGLLIALLSLVRAFRPYRSGPPSPLERVHLVRSQVAVVLAVLITLVADAIAMARHPLLWMGTAQHRLVALLGGLAVVAVAVLLLIRASQKKLPETGSPHWPLPAITILLAVSIMALYPEQLINGTATHLLTIVVADFVLFVTMRVLLDALVPYPGEQRTETAPAHGRFSRAGYRWGAVLLLGVMIGAFAFLSEMSEGGGSLPASRLLFVGSVFVGVGLAGLLVAYTLLAKPLGLAPRA